MTATFELPRDPTRLESRATFREAIGGDLALELVTTSGEPVVPYQFVLGDANAGSNPDFDPFDDDRAYAHVYCPTIVGDRRSQDARWFRAGLFERFRLRIAAVKTSGEGQPRCVAVKCSGPPWKGPPRWTLSILFFLLYGLPSALLLRLVLWAIAKRRASK